MPRRIDGRRGRIQPPWVPQWMRQLLDHALREDSLIPLLAWKVVQLVALGTQIGDTLPECAGLWGFATRRASAAAEACTPSVS